MAAIAGLGLDLSEAYIRDAQRHLSRWSRLNLVVGNAEAIPLPDDSQDAVTSIFMLHELPPKVRRMVLREAARVLKPGGRLVILDSLQNGDEPDYDSMLDRFPQLYHEPYYESYLRRGFHRDRTSVRARAPAQHQGPRIQGDGFRQSRCVAAESKKPRRGAGVDAISKPNTYLFECPPCCPPWPPWPPCCPP